LSSLTRYAELGHWAHSLGEGGRGIQRTRCNCENVYRIIQIEGYDGIAEVRNNKKNGN